MSQNPKAGPGTEIDTLLEIGLPPGEGIASAPVTSATPEHYAPSIPVVLPPRADSQSVTKRQQADEIAEAAKQEASLDPLRPRLRRPEKDGLKRRNRRKNVTAHVAENASKVTDKYEPLLGSRPCLHAVWSIRRMTRSAPGAVASYYVGEEKEAWPGMKQPAHALLPIVRSSSLDWIGAADCTINQAVFQTDIFKGRRSLFRFDSMRPFLGERVYDSKSALLKIISNTFAPKIAFASDDMQGAV